MKRLTELFRSLYNTEPQSIQQITGSGSPRQYYRLQTADSSVIGVVGTSKEENEAFIRITQHFEAQGLPVPHVLATTDDNMVYLQSDLGSTSLYDYIAQGRNNEGNYSEAEQQMLHKTIAALPQMQIRGAQGLDTSLCYPTPSMDRTSILFDLNYFKYCFLKFIPNIDFNEISLQKDLDKLCDDIVALTSSTLPTIILRDCQARNIMLHQTPEGNTQPYFIDYQGCRLGPIEYDLASFLWQASSRYPQSLRDSLIDTYLESLNKLTEVKPQVFHSRLKLMVLFRLLQVLGAYGFRGYHEHKSYFVNSIPPAIENLKDILKQDTAKPYPYLEGILYKIVDFITAQQEALSKEIANKPKAREDVEPLTVTIYSFSYKKGIPADPSGNGGGYVFDCRSTHNPGRYEPYKKLTGMDQPVISFLEEDGEILTFLDSIYPLAERHVERYINRGFTSLMFCFGCTGGQHRSVYSAQHLAERLHTLFPQINIHLIHREQGVDVRL